ncbi:hypothetical protein [Tahibacter amnicola]|uniref:VapC45 PIN like domain-containing protein n=1 Tax=Tahibacter amnicola TaxID=2976241 RepID=A0ABY6BGE6_9GAMM|nr:hypothetical protein [Tahibacter amnicola]UXI68939.1 hypothetical protein N4264_04590 [Tahibacter amnicola]
MSVRPDAPDAAPVFFTDRDLGKQFPEILKSAGLVVERHAEHFAPDCPDPAWLREIGSRGWIAITHDRNIRYKPNELAAVVEHDVALLVVIGHARYAELAQAFVATLPRILRFVGQHHPPYIAKVYRPGASEAAIDPGASGRVELWYPQSKGR